MCAAEAQKKDEKGKPETMEIAFSEAVGRTALDRSEEKTPVQKAIDALHAIGMPTSDTNRRRAMVLANYGMPVTVENVGLPVTLIERIGRQRKECAPEDALASLGIPADEANLALAKSIIRAGWPVDKETFENATILRLHEKEVTDRLLKLVKRLRKLEFLVNKRTLNFTDKELRKYAPPLEGVASFYANFSGVIYEERGGPLTVNAEKVVELNELVDVAPVRVKRIIEAMLKPNTFEGFTVFISDFFKTNEGKALAARLEIKLPATG